MTPRALFENTDEYRQIAIIELLNVDFYDGMLKRVQHDGLSENTDKYRQNCYCGYSVGKAFATFKKLQKLEKAYLQYPNA